MGRATTPEDYVKIRAMVQEMLSQEDLKKFYKFMDVIGNNMFPRYGSTALYNADIIRKFAIIFASTQKMWNGFSIKPMNLASTPFLLDHRDAETLYQELDPDCQRFFLDLEEVRFSNLAYVYMRLLKRLGYSPAERLLEVQDVDLYQYMTKERTDHAIRNFIKGLKKNAPNSDTDGFDYSFPSDEFIEYVREEKPLWGNLQESKAEILFLMRTVYGEQVVIDLIRTVGLHEGRLDCDHLLDLMDDWSNLKHYPVDWILKIFDVQEDEFEDTY